MKIIKNLYPIIIIGFLSIAPIACLGGATKSSNVDTSKSWKQRLHKLYPPIDKQQTPPWLAHPVAMKALNPNTVLKPWTPVKADDSSVQVWGREYLLGNGGFPKQIVVTGQKILAAPIKLIIKYKGQSHPINLSKPKLIKKHKGQVKYLSHTTSSAITINIESTYEYDGFSKFDLIIHNPKRQILNRMELIIPLKSRHAILFNNIDANTLGGTSSQLLNKAGALPAKQRMVYSSGFKPYFWFGDHKRGLSWFSSSSQYMVPDKHPIMQIVRKENRATLYIYYTDKAIRVPSDMHISFGIMATPIKPLPKGWRNWRVVYAAPKTSPAPAKDQALIWDYDFQAIQQYPRPRDPAAFKHKAEGLRQKGADRVYAYLAPDRLATTKKLRYAHNVTWTTPEWIAYGSQWAVKPNMPLKWHYQAVSVKTTWADFSLWCVKNWITKYGIDGVYVDGAFPYGNMNSYQGCGYTDANGKRHPTYAIDAMRKYYKRLAWLFQHFAHGRPAIIAHSSAGMAAPILSFADMTLDGEQFFYNVKNWKGTKPPSYLAMGLMKTFQSEVTTQKLGLAPVFLPELRQDIVPKSITKSIYANRQILALTLLNGVLVWANPYECNRKLMRSVYNILGQFNTGASDVTFNPYWQQKNQSAITPGQVKLSFYQRPDKLLAVVVNSSNQQQKIAINLSKLGYQGIKAINAETQNHIKISNNILEYIIPARDFRLFLISY